MNKRILLFIVNYVVDEPLFDYVKMSVLQFGSPSYFRIPVETKEKKRLIFRPFLKQSFSRIKKMSRIAGIKGVMHLIF